MNRRSFFALTLGLTTTALLAGCGGGGTSGVGLVNRRAVVQLPTGYSVAQENIVVEAGRSVTALDAAGAFTVQTPDSDVPTLAFLRDKSGQGILLGFLPVNDTPLTPRSAAVALLYYTLGGFTLPEASRRPLVTLLEAEAATVALGEAIARRILANPYALSTEDTELNGALKAAYDTLTTTGRSVRVESFTKQAGLTRAVEPLLQVEPAGRQSNLEVVQATGTNVTAVNHSRRYCKVYTYRTGTPEPLPAAQLQGAPIKLNSTNALGIFSTINNLQSGQTAYVPVKTDPIALALAAGSTKTLYELVIVGASSSDLPRGFYSEPKYANEKDRWIQDREDLCLLTWWQNFILPIFFEALGIAGLAATTASVEGTLAAIKAIEATAVKELLFKAGKGSLIAAAGDFWQLAATDTLVGEQVRQAMKPLYEAALGSVAAETLAARIALFARIALRAAIAATLVLAGGDLAAVSADVLSAQPAERWSATVFQPTLKLNPTAAKIGAGARLTLTASLPGVTGPKVIYAWSKSGGAGATLSSSEPGKVGESFETTSGTVDLVTTPSDQGTITVSVTAYIEKDGARSEAGQSAATITVDPTQVVYSGKYKILSWARTDPAAFPGLHQTNVYVIVPRVANAKSYSIRAFTVSESRTLSLGAEPLTGLPEWDLSFSYSDTLGSINLTMPEVSRVGNDVYMAIAGTGGDGSSDVAGYESRFQGMTVEVTAQL